MTDWKRLLAFATGGDHPAPLALATLVRRSGSSYRAPGARMVITDDGAYTGCISGGCLEELVAQVGRRVLATGRAEQLRLDTRPHFGCPGVLEVFVEPLPGGLVSRAAEAMATRASFRLATVFSSENEPLGTRLLTDDDAGPAETTGVFIETVGPQPRLVVVGWLPDAEPLFRLAGVLGWETWRVVASAELRAAVPADAREPVVVCDPERLPGRFAADSRTAVLVMTHHLGRDTHYLRHVLPRDYGYIGMLGSRTRREAVLGELGELGLLDDDTLPRRFYAPMGLDIGADHPDSIALAILAEIHAVWQRRDAGFLRDRAGPLHTRPAPALSFNP
jgi:xanthine dehydrogenase accessory factor